VADLWGDGRLSAVAIGRELDMTKNQIIGIVDRNGLSRNGAARIPRRTIRRIAAQEKKAKKRAKRIEFPPTGRCLWGHGHVGEPGFHFCGERVRSFGDPWCERHAARVFTRAAKHVEAADD
jgi:hypothetical protein